MWRFIDYGETGIGEPAAVMLRPGNAGSDTAADHKQVLAEALAQLPGNPAWRAGRKVLVRPDSSGGTHDFLDCCHRRRVQYSIGFALTDDIVTAMDTYSTPNRISFAVAKIDARQAKPCCPLRWRYSRSRSPVNRYVVRAHHRVSRRTGSD